MANTTTKYRKTALKHMNQVYLTINRYHSIFESYKDVIAFKSVWLWVSLIAILGFGYTIFWVFAQNSWPKSSMPQDQRMLIACFFELITIGCWLKLQSLKDRIVIKRAQKALESLNKLTSETNINNLKSMWFEAVLMTPKEKYLSVAEDIDKMLMLEKKHKSSLSISQQDICNLIFTSESKSRTLIMFMGGSAAIIALSIANGANINSIFDFFHGVTIRQFLQATLIFSTSAIITYFFFRYILLVIILFFETCLDKADGFNTVSHRRASVFIRQLLKLYQLKKSRITSGYSHTKHGVDLLHWT